MLQRYVAAFEAYDMDAITALLHEDAKQSMPPYEMWLLGREDILRWWTGPGIGCKGSRLTPVVANGLPAFGQYRPSGPGGSFEPWALQVLELSDGQIVGFTAFLDTDRLFRISYLIGIFKALNILYPRKLADAWVRLPNTNRIFGGRTPLESMMQGGLPAMQMVRRLLDARRGGL